MIRKARRSLLLAALLAVSAGLGAQETSLKVLTVHNRPARDLISALQPLAGPGGSVTSLDDRLIVRASPEALRQIERALGELDVTPRSLWISVRQAGSGFSAAREARVTGSVAIGGGTVQLTHEGGSVTTRRSQTVATGAFGAADAESSTDTVQRIRALEGRPAFIQRGRAVPMTPIVAGRGGASVPAGTVYAEAERRLLGAGDPLRKPRQPRARDGGGGPGSGRHP